MILPPLLQMADGRRAGPVSPTTRIPKELALHIAVAGKLRRFCRDDWRWSHFPAGELRDRRTAAKLKAMGTMPGWPDILMVSPVGLLHCLELKRIGRDLTDSQRDFQTWCSAHGVPFAVVRTLDEAMAVLASWGCLRAAQRELACA